MKNTQVLLGILCVAAALSAYAYDEAEVESGGTIQGVVNFEGVAPPRHELPNVGCKDHKILSEDLIVTDGKLMNAVISIEKIEKGKPFSTLPQALDQKNCCFVPHVVVAFSGKKVKIANSDDFGHNVHTRPVINNGTNVSISPEKSSLTQFEDAERIAVRCDIHPSMSAWIIVSEHPYAVVSAPDGSFKMDKVPPGKYTLNIWHEMLGEQKKEVTVKAGETVDVPVRYSK